MGILTKEIDQVSCNILQFVYLHLQIKRKTSMYLVVVDNIRSTNSKMHVNLMFKNKCLSSVCFMGKHYVVQNSNACWLTEISRASQSSTFKPNPSFHTQFNENPLWLIPLGTKKRHLLRLLSSQEREVGGVLEGVWVCDNLMPSDKKIQIGLETKFFLCIPSTY